MNGNDTLRRRLALFAMTLAAGAIGWIVSAILLRIGLVEMGFRYAASFTALYFSFVLILWKWLNSGAIRIAEAKKPSWTEEPIEPREAKPEIHGSVDIVSSIFGEASLWAAVVVFAVTFLFCLIVAPILIVDLAVVELLTVSIALRARKLEANIGFVEVLQKTYPLGIVFLCLSSGGGFLLSAMFPGAQSLVRILFSSL